MSRDYPDRTVTVVMPDAHVPPALKERMDAAVRRQLAAADGAAALASDAVDPALLAEAGLACLEDALAAGDDRRSAFALLAADALITAACAAAATTELPAALSARRFAALLER